MTQNQQTYRRATAAALTGLVVQMLLFLAISLVGLWSGSPALYAATFHLLGGLPIWIVLTLIYKQHELERVESLESEQLTRATPAAAMFEEQAEDLSLARRRLANLYRWGVGTVSVMVSVYLIVLGIYWLYRNRGYAVVTLDRGAERPQVLVAACLAVAFLAFIVARYVSGMTRVAQWQLLRGGAGYLMGSAVVSGLAAVAALFYWLDIHRVFEWLGVVIPALMLLLGLEIILTFLLSAYRPRKPGEIARPPFDSRVLGLLTSPESLGQAISEAINYQFGFEITRSWFYQLLARRASVLLGVGLTILILISCIVIVDPHEQAVITRFGDLARIVDPGLRLKLPWPISRARNFPVTRVHEISAGSVRGRVDRSKAILWTTQHTTEEEQYLITSATAQAPGEEHDATHEDGARRGIALLVANIKVQFRIRDLEKFVRNSTDPQMLIESMKQRQRWEVLLRQWEQGGQPGTDPLANKTAIDPCPLLTAFATHRCSAYVAQHNIDTLLSVGRVQAGDQLRVQIQQDADQLGVEILFVGLSGIHPPQKSDVAAAFHEQIGALQERQSSVEKARREAIVALAQVAGSQARAKALHEQIQAIEAHQGDLEARDRLQKKLDKTLAASRGQAAEILYEAYAERCRRVIEERIRANEFSSMLEGYELAPRYYSMRLYYDVLGRALVNARKYVVSDDVQVPEVWFDLKEVESELGFLNPDR